jgi:Ankyrin repeat
LAKRFLPVFPNLEQLRHQAKDLLRAIRRGEAAALEDLAMHHPERVEPAAAKLADAQLALARSYGVPSWPRLVIACKMTSAIWHDDIDTVRTLVRKDPRLLHEDARGVKGNWGPPLSFAANLGRGRIIAMLRGMGAEDVQYAFGRAVLRGKIDAARQLIAMGARPLPGEVMGPCEGQNADGLALLLELGAELADEHGNRIAPVSMLIGTYCRNTESKHRCLEMCAERGIELPDTPPMAVHRGRIDLLEALLERDPRMLERRFTADEIYQPAAGHRADPSLVCTITPPAGGTLLHLAVDSEEIEIARWLIAKGADVNAKATVDADGFGGHTALFGCVGVMSLRSDDEFARLLLDSGADPNARASIRKRVVDAGEDETEHVFHDVTPLGWGEQFHYQKYVNRAAMQLIAERGGHL